MKFTNTEAIHILGGMDEILAAGVVSGLHKAYAGPDRHYHDWHHALSVLSWVNHVCELFTEEQLDSYTYRDLKLAALYHDVVYTAQGSPRNEADSAARLVSEVGGDCGRACALIGATARHGQLESEDVPLAVQLFLDCDIATLGEFRWEIVKWNDDNVMKELLAMYPEDRVREGRRAFLEGLLKKRSIYLSTYFRNRFETQARSNIARLLAEQVR